jgi:hypothetical protein
LFFRKREQKIKKKKKKKTERTSAFVRTGFCISGEKITEPGEKKDRIITRAAS